MTRDDLKTGMVVELRGGAMALVIGNAVCVYVKDLLPTGAMRIKDYSNGLKDAGEYYNKDWDIMKVYAEPSDLSGANLLWHLKQSEEYFEKELLWERPEEVEELTLEQVCKELGRDIKIVK